jgi:hypothetical protein
MNQSAYDPSHLEGLFKFFALQLARIHSQLYPEAIYPKHVSGPRRPDMQEQERSMKIR